MLNKTKGYLQFVTQSLHSILKQLKLIIFLFLGHATNAKKHCSLGLFVAPSAVIAQGQDGVTGQA